MTIVIQQPMSYTYENHEPTRVSTVVRGKTAPAPGYEATSASTPALSVDSIRLSDFETFSPELILFIAKKRMDDIDGQVRANMSEIEDLQTESKEINQKLLALKKLKEHQSEYGIEGPVRLDGDGATGEKDGRNQIELNGEKVTIREFMDAHGIRPEDLGLHDRTEDIVADGGGQKYDTGKDEAFEAVDLSRLDSHIDELETRQKDINTGNELRMVKLQSLMQQRTQIITLATNLLQKLDEGAQSIVRNLA